MNNVVSPFSLVIFGATGDLTARKLMPAIYHLLKEKILPEKFRIFGAARRNFSDEEFRAQMYEAVAKYSRTKVVDRNVWNRLSANLQYQSGLFEDEKMYLKLAERLNTYDKAMGACITRFFYLATPPQNYSVILEKLHKTGLSVGCGGGVNKGSASSVGYGGNEGDRGSKNRWTRVLIEKPFGNDLETSRMLEDQLSSVFEERQIYRIDHYLAKETIQNILAFRFANTLFKSVWDRDHIDNIQFTLAEAGGVGARGQFYDKVGALRDIAQNHLMAMLAYTAMEEPLSFSAEHTRAERIRALEAIDCIEPENVAKNVVRGQYGITNYESRIKNHESRIIEKNIISAYRGEENVERDSCTETYVAMKLQIDNERWKGVPFYLRTGKRLKRNAVAIDIQFKNPQSKLFSEFKFTREAHANTLRINVQPQEGINFRFFGKEPGLSLSLKPVDMNFSYERSFGENLIDSYEKLLLDSMLGDQTLFATNAGFKATWEVTTKILRGWNNLPCPEFPNYLPGSWGPVEADELLLREGRHWLLH
jgi:glucose-6-phosphate 1-dehydrogenase